MINQGDDSVSKVLSTQAWGPRFKSPTLTWKANCNSTHLQPQCSENRDRKIPGTFWTVSIDKKLSCGLCENLRNNVESSKDDSPYWPLTSTHTWTCSCIHTYIHTQKLDNIGQVPYIPDLQFPHQNRTAILPPHWSVTRSNTKIKKGLAIASIHQLTSIFWVLPSFPLFCLHGSLTFGPHRSILHLEDYTDWLWGFPETWGSGSLRSNWAPDTSGGRFHSFWSPEVSSMSLVWPFQSHAENSGTCYSGVV